MVWSLFNIDVCCFLPFVGEHIYECGRCGVMFMQGLAAHKCLHSSRIPLEQFSDQNKVKWPEPKVQSLPTLPLERPLERLSDQRRVEWTELEIQSLPTLSSGRPHMCDHCGKSYVERKTLNRHKKLKHGVVKN